VVPCRLRAQRGAPQGRRGRGLSEESRPEGLTAAVTGVVTLDDGRTAFVKRATDHETRESLLVEAEVLLRLDGLHAPRLLDVLDEGTAIVVEDLSHATWPPPLPPAANVFAALETTGAVTPPERVRRMQRSYDPWDGVTPPWWIATPHWWRRALPALRDASTAARFDGSSLVHGDPSPGNMALDGGRLVLVDWGEAACGSLDWARALAAVEYRMRELTAVAPIREPAPVVATLAGFALREYLHWVSADLDPEDGRATRIRTTKTAQFAAVLAWAAELLHLDPPMFGSPTPPRSAS
jgi:hypothetical protein